MLPGEDKKRHFPTLAASLWDACVQAHKCSSNDAHRSDENFTCFSTSRGQNPDSRRQSTSTEMRAGPEADLRNTIDILHHIPGKPIVPRLLFFGGEFIQKCKSSRSSSELCLSNCSDQGSMKTKSLCNNHPSLFDALNPSICVKQYSIFSC